MNLLVNKNNIKPYYTNNLFSKFSTTSVINVLGLLLIVVLANTQAFSQKSLTDSTFKNNESIAMRKPTIDTTQIVVDTSLNNIGLKAKVVYSAQDSIRFDLKNKKVFLYNNAVIDYQEIKLEAADVKIHFDENLLFAEGVLDSVNKLIGKPIFTEGDQVYKSKFMKYNYNTKKAFIKEVFTEDGEGYLHGKIIKKLGDETINVSYGSFTTCSNEEHPHFEFRYKKSKVIPGKKVVTGPAYLVIEEVPTPLFIPFGLFPNKQGQRSGIVIPTYGESANRGFYLENGGYYWAINDRLDLKLTGDIYTYGSWSLKALSNYVKKYKYRGSLNLTFATNKEKDVDGSRKDFAVRWQHSQDAKARPNSRFTANVNIVSSQYNVYNPTSTQDYLSSTFQSGISYQTKIAGQHSLTLNASHSQNTQTKMVNITLPEISFSVNRFYPFRKKDKVGGLKWYDNISVNYTLNAKNTVNMADSLLFQPGFGAKMKNGMNQKIPISVPFKLFKYFTLTNSIQIQDRVYFSSLKKTMRFEIDDTESLVPLIDTDTVSGFNNIFEYSLSSSLTTKIYGMLNFKKGPIRAIRHVFTPNISFRYAPDFSADNWGYYDYIYTNPEKTEKIKYSRFDRYIYGAPSERKQGQISFSFSNNLEMKVPSKRDTINGLKKIVLIEDFRISGSYDMTKEDFNWSPISFSGRTTLFKKLRINYSSKWSPYAVDEYGYAINELEWDFRRKLIRQESNTWKFSFSYDISSKKTGKDSEKNKQNDTTNGETDDPVSPDLMPQYNDIMNNPDDYVDWNIPWSLNLSYNYSQSTNYDYERILGENGKYNITKDFNVGAHTIAINGNLSITKKTKITFRTNYDIKNKEISYTSINIHRDLHCWEMRFNWIPVGRRKSWNFTIAIKSTLLQDLKLEKKKDFRDR